MRRLTAGALLGLCTIGLLLAGCSPAGPADSSILLGGERLDVIVVDDEADRAQGLQGYDGLAENEAMLFVWDDAEVRTFAMKEVSFPIEVVFIDESSEVSAVFELEPGDGVLVTSPTPSRFVVEVAAGWTRENGVAPGSVFEPPEDLQ